MEKRRFGEIIMAYENIELIVAAITGDIYMTRTKDDGAMDTNNRRIATNDVMRAAAEWFISNGKTVAHFGGHGTLAWVPAKEGLTPQEVKAHIDQLKK